MLLSQLSGKEEKFLWHSLFSWHFLPYLFKEGTSSQVGRLPQSLLIQTRYSRLLLSSCHHIIGQMRFPNKEVGAHKTFEGNQTTWKRPKRAVVKWLFCIHVDFSCCSFQSFIFLSGPSPIVALCCQSLSHWLMLLLRLDWCDPDIALFDTFWKFIFSLNRAEKWFNSKFNSKQNPKYSFKKIFIQ